MGISAIVAATRKSIGIAPSFLLYFLIVIISGQWKVCSSFPVWFGFSVTLVGLDKGWSIDSKIACN